MQAHAQSAVIDWFPVHEGDQWIYAHETRDDNGDGNAHLEIHRWKTDETAFATWAIAVGTLVEMRVRVAEGSPPPAPYRVEPNPAHLIRGDCLYMNVDWEPRDHQLNPAYREGVLAGQIAADFCFPLVAGKTWGAMHWGRAADGNDWQVVASRMHDPLAPGKQRTFHVTSISSYLGSGMTADIWFEKGVGIVREEETHHGTVGEERTRLLHFEPAPPHQATPGPS